MPPSVVIWRNWRTRDRFYEPMVGHVVELAVREFRADRAILSIARQVIVLADHNKFNRVSSMLIAPVTAANLIISDQHTPKAIVNQLDELGIQVMLA